jgi:hypothetical protein
MALWDLLGSSKESKIALHFYDDDSFQFIKREVDSASLVEKKDNKVVRAWRHFFNAEKHFDGFKNMRAGNITITCGRDFILDPFNQIPEGATPAAGKPKKDDASIKKWTSEVAEAQRYIVMNKPSNMLIYDKITMFLGIAFILEVLLFGASKAWGW